MQYGLRSRMYVCMQVICMFFEHFLGTETTYRRALSLQSHKIGSWIIHCWAGCKAVGLPARAWHVIVASMGFTLCSEQSSPLLHVTLAQILRYQNWEKNNENWWWKLSGHHFLERDAPFNSEGPRVAGRGVDQEEALWPVIHSYPQQLSLSRT